MGLLTSKQFEDKYGKDASKAFGNFPVKSTTPNFKERTKANFMSGLGTAKEAFTDSMNKKRNPISTGAKLIAGVSGAVFSPVTAGLQPVTDPTIGAGINYVADKVGENKGLQKFAMGKGGDIAERFTEDVGNLNTAFGTVVGLRTGPKIAAKASNTASIVTDEVSSNVKGAVNKGKEMVKNIANKKPTDPLTTAIDDATPNYELSTPTVRKELLPRVKEGGTFNKKRTVTPDKMNIDAGTELSKVPGYRPDATKLEKYQLAQKEVAVRGQRLETELAKENIAIPKREMFKTVTDAINKVPETSLILQKADPLLKNYIRVTKNALSKVDGTLQGLLKLRKILDDAYENTRGKQSFGSDKITAIDEINKAARNALTQKLISMAKNVNVKASLKAQWDLYRAIDELLIAAEKESGTKLGRFVQNNPVASKVAETIGKGVGLGGVINLLD